MIELHNFKWAHRKIEQVISFYQNYHKLNNEYVEYWFNGCLEREHKLISKWITKIHKDLGVK